MLDNKKNSSYDPKVILQAAIKELDLFTQSEVSRLEVSENGHLIASKETLLKKVVGLARSYIGPIFSEQVRQEQARKFGELKQAILNARDIIQSHSALILKFKEGDDSQRTLAEYALSAIQRYNSIITHEDSSETTKYDVYNYERNLLLLDQEIKDRPIELPHTLTIKFDSHLGDHPARKMFKELSDAFNVEAFTKTNLAISTTHKKTIQFMIDTFHMKAIRMIQTHVHLQNSMAEIVPLVKGAFLEIDEESNADFITMQQLLEMGPGFFILVSGCFKRHSSDPKFLTMPILDSFRLSFQLTHSGFPYPSQHTGWALSDKWVEAYPLRTDQVPLFHQVDQRKKRLAQQHLFDQSFIQRARQHAKLKQEIFDQNRELFLPLYLQLQTALRQNFCKEEDLLLNAFYKELIQASSPFDLMSQTHQQIQDLFIRQPIKALEEEWLGGGTSLRTGSPQEKFQAACQKLESHRSKGQEKLDPAHPRHAFILNQGLHLGHACQSIGLQYQSEKMGFSPPLLSDFERKLQTCAFQQLLSFMDECENLLGILEPSQIKEALLAAWLKDLELLQAPSIEEIHSLPLAIIDELEIYFNSRFYSFYPRNSGKVV